MSWDEIRNLQPDDFFRWPLKTQLGAVAVVTLFLGILFYLFLLKPLNEQYASLQGEEEFLKGQVREKQRLAAHYDEYQQQLKEIERRLRLMLRQLPSQTEIPSLLDDITLAGRSRGLDFELFQPLPEQALEFNAEVPVKIKVLGGYDAMGNFAAAVAAMPRIVTLHDLDIKRVADAGATATAPAQSGAAGAEVLRLECTAKTYRYLDEAEVKARAQAQKEAKS